jgi:hypothetical protein
MITIGYSTRKSNPELQEYFRKSCGLSKVQVIEKVNTGEKSLNQTYNEILKESENDIVILCHDDLYFDNKGWGYKILDHFKKSDFGILGVAGSTSLPKSGMWWEDKRKMIGIVNHEHDGKKWESKYSESQGNSIKETILIDGLFIALDKKRIKENFNEDVKGFHFYDLEFCIRNYRQNVKIGVITNIRITHKSIGMTNESWEENRKLFAKRHKDILPLKMSKQKGEKLKILMFTLQIDELDLNETVELANRLSKLGHSITLISEFKSPTLYNILKKNNIKLLNMNEPPGFKMGDGKWFINTPEGKIVSQENNLYKVSEVNYDLVIVKDNAIMNHVNSLYPEFEKIFLSSYDGEPYLPNTSVKKEILISDIFSHDIDNILYEVVNMIDTSEKKQKIKILSGHSDKGGSTTAFINLTNELNSKGFDCTFYGPHTWHLNKCQSGMLNDAQSEYDDIFICHFISLPEKPKVKKVIFSIHEKNLFEIADVKPFWDEVVFLHEGHRNYHNRFNGKYSLIPNLKEHLDKKDKSDKDLIAGVIGTIDENKQTHISIQRALDDGCEKVLIFGSISEANYYESKVKPLFSDKVVHMGHADGKQSMYDMIGRVYHSSISEVACLIKDECHTTGTKFFGNEATSHQVSDLTNDEIINKWIKVFDI